MIAQLQTMMMFALPSVALAWTPNGSYHTHAKISKLQSPHAISVAHAHAHMQAPTHAPIPLRATKTHSTRLEKIEVFKSLESWASECVLPLVKPVERSWQPHDLLPDSSLPLDEFTDEVRALRNRTAELPDDYLVVLVGDMINEESLPSFQTWINKPDGVGDEPGSCMSPWAVWSRAWTAEENKHGDLLKTYLYLSGRVDMLMVEKTIHYFLRAGMDLKTKNDPFMGPVYTSFQERVAFISHGNTARLAKESGDPVLARICGTIAADEKRHETAYMRIVAKLLEVDPTGAMMAISEMMRKKITMPAHLMHDGKDPHLFDHFSAVAQRLGVYTVGDYADIMEYLIEQWRLEELQGLTAEGRRAQEFVCGLAPRIRRLQEHIEERARKMEPPGIKFSWIFNREVPLI